MKFKLLLIIIGLMLCTPVIAKNDTTSENYLKNRKHFSILNPFAECAAQKFIKKSLQKETNGKLKVKFDGNTLSSMKKGVFKNLEFSGKNLTIDGIEVPYLKIKSISDYNWIDYKQKPLVVKTDMNYAYEIHLSENSINAALNEKEYRKTLNKVNNIAYPLFTINDVDIKIRNDKFYMIVYYNFPISPAKKDKTFVFSTGFKVEDNKILTSNINIDKSYGNIQTNKVSNLINLLDPLSFTLNFIDDKKCKARVENVKIVDNIVQVSGKIYVKGEG